MKRMGQRGETNKTPLRMSRKKTKAIKKETNKEAFTLLR